MSEIREGFKVLGAVIGVLLAIFALIVLFSSFGIWHTRTFGVAQQNAQTDVFEQSQAYVQGKRSTLRQMLVVAQRAKTDDERAAALAQLRQEASSVPDDVIPDDVRSFLNTH
jgi:hypothetical protein